MARQSESALGLAVEGLESSLEKLLEDVRRLRQENEQSVWRNDKDAAEGTGLGPYYWRRIRHLVPHMVIPADGQNPESIVYPKESVREWIKAHTETY